MPKKNNHKIPAEKTAEKNSQKNPEKNQKNFWNSPKIPPQNSDRPVVDHQPVLLDQVLAAAPPHTTKIIDGTAGHGGHMAALHSKFPDATIHGVDRDPTLATRLLKTFSQNPKIKISHKSYTQLSNDELASADFILLDLGVNMEHFRDTQRGFSLHGDAPLDMRFDTSSGPTAAEFLRTVSTQKLWEILQKRSDFSPRAADRRSKILTQPRDKLDLTSTAKLRDHLVQHGARKPVLLLIFQALRIATNAELDELDNFLTKLKNLSMKSDSRIAIITFHSVEDRLVKIAFKSLAATPDRSLVNKKTIKPSRPEIQKNRAARSAQLRILQKT